MTLRRRPDTPMLEIDGLVTRPGAREWAEIAGLPGRIEDVAVEAYGFAGGAVPMRSLLAGAGIDPSATHCTVVSGDGNYAASIPLDDLTAMGWLIFGGPAEPLPRDRGGPLRVVVPQGRTLCWNVKDVVALRLTAGAEPDSVPADPPH
jgi:DMSO/TMAO reductase YedYZ molybdopterin-dependent catalytic subunit